MKPQKEVTFSVALLFLSQNVFFPIGVQAQSNTAQVVGAVGAVVTQIPGMYTQQPNSPNFMTDKLKMQMNRCITEGALGITGNAEADTKSITALTEKWSTKLGKKEEDSKNLTSAQKCSADCNALKNNIEGIAEEPSCTTYAYDKGEVAGEIVTRTAKPGASGKLKSIQDGIQAYVSCLEGKKGCADAEQAALNKQIAAFNCQMQAMQVAVQDASQSLQRSLQENQKVYAQMNQHQKELGEQMQQVDEILGPDPELGKSGNSQFQGLLGLQKELNENLPKMVEAEAKFKTDIEKLKVDTKTNEQNLEATRVNVASSCIKGSRNVGVSGGYSLTCFKPVTVAGKDGSSTNAVDRNGNIKYSKQSCGPYDYIRSKIEQRAFITSRGVMMTQDRREQSAENAAAFDSLVDSINRAMGDYDQKGASGARLDSDVHSWGDIESKVSSNIDAVASQSGVDVRTMLRSVAGHCFKEADSWKNKQIRSSDSEYSKKKMELKATQTAMTSQMDTGITTMNKSYGDVMAVMFNKHVTLSRAQCTRDNPELMSDCFSKIRLNVQNLLEGNGALTTTAKQIKGGPMTPGFSVQCRGLNGCVTAFKNVRDSQKNYMRARQKDKESFVNQSNVVTNQQLSVLTGQLSTMQNSLLAQYDLMKASFTKMGIDAPEKPKFMDAEQLQGMEGPDKSMGPFQNPKSMSAVLSGMMQPGGMVNFGDTGLRDIQKQIADKAKEKGAKAAEELKTYRAMASKYNNIAGECGIVGLGGGGSSVGSLEDSCIDAATKANSCQGSFNASNDPEIKKLEEDLAKQIAIEKSTPQNPADEKAKKDAPAKIAEIQKQLDEEKKKAIQASTEASNYQTLSFLSEVFSKMADSEKISKDDYEKMSSISLSKIAISGGDCREFRNLANQCRSSGKGMYTEDAKTGNMVIKGQ